MRRVRNLCSQFTCRFNFSTAHLRPRLTSALHVTCDGQRIDGEIREHLETAETRKGGLGEGGSQTSVHTHTHHSTDTPTHTHRHTQARIHTLCHTHTYARNTHTRLYTNNRHHRVYLTSIKEVHSCGVIRSFSCDHLTSTNVAA